MKCIPGSFIQDHSLFLLGHITSCIFMQGVCNLGEVLNKAPVVPSKSDKTLNGSVCGGFGVLCDGLQVIPARPYPFQGDTMPQVLNFFLKELTVGRFKFQSMESKMLPTLLASVRCVLWYSNK